MMQYDPNVMLNKSAFALMPNTTEVSSLKDKPSSLFEQQRQHCLVTSEMPYCLTGTSLMSVTFNRLSFKIVNFSTTHLGTYRLIK